MSDYGVTVTAECSVPATLGGGIFGPSRHTVTVDAKAEGPVSKMDLALVLDVSSSMMANTKISDMKSAATLLVSKVITADTGTRVRVSVVPYATGVNAGQYGNIALDRSVGDDADGDGLDRVCVVERTMGEQFTDAPPGPGQYMEALNPDPNTQAYYGPLESNRVLPLTSTASDLTTLIGNLNPNPLTGPTIGHAGIAWGWYTLSPKWSSIWPSDSNPLPMNTLRNRKVMVIMSDGAFSFPLDSSMGTASEQAEALCAAARLAGVEIFTVGFDFASIADSTARQTAIDTMANCATDSEHAFLATDATQLHNAFADIAAQLFAGTALVE